MKSLANTRKASRQEAITTWEQLTHKQQNSVVGKTFQSILSLLSEPGETSLFRVLDTLFDEQSLVTAHTSLKTQFINRPLLDETGKPLLKLCVSRISLKAADTEVKTKRAYQEASVWFEVTNQLAANSPGLAVIPSTDISQHFTETKAIDLEGKQTVEAAKSAALKKAEEAQALNTSGKTAQNFGHQGSRHGTSEEDFQSDVQGRESKLANSRLGDPIRDKTSSTVPALATLLTWAKNKSPDAPRLYALLGDAGAGKTSLAQQFVRVLNGETVHELWETSATENPKAIALFIDLSDLSGVPNLAALSLEEMLVLALKRRDGSQIQRVEHVKHFIVSARAGNLIFVFDGLDELLKNDSTVLQKVFEQFIKVVERRASPSDSTSPPKVIVSCRSHYFRDVETQHSFFTARGRSNVINEDYRCLTLLPWGEDLIESYLARRLGKDEAAKLMRLIATTYNLEELASKPVLLSMMAENLQALLIEKESGQDIVASTLYSQTVAGWISRDNGKHRINPAHKPLLMGALASALWNDETESWPANRLDQWLVKTVHDLFPGHYSSSDLPGLQNDLRTATFIVRPDDRQFNFAHKSYSEYFLARFIIDGLDQVADQFWALNQFRSYMPTNSLNRETLEFLTEMWAHDEPRRDRSLLHKRTKVVTELLQFQGDPEANDNAPDLHAVLWEALRAIRSPIAPTADRPINLRGLTFSRQRWEDLDVSNVILDISGANLRGLYALRCKFGRIITNEKTNLSQSIFRQCETDRVAWEQAIRVGLTLRPNQPPSNNGNKPLWGPWSLPSVAVGISKVAYNPSGTVLAGASIDGSVRLWDAKSYLELATLRGHDSSVSAVAFSFNGEFLASSSWDKTVRIWNAKNFFTLEILKGHTSRVNAVAFNHDGSLLASASFGGSIRIWDLKKAKQIGALKGHRSSVTSIAFSPKSNLLVSASTDWTIRLWDCETQTAITTLAGHKHEVNNVAFSPDGNKLASVSTDQMFLWDITKTEKIITFRTFGSWINDVGFSSDGGTLFSVDMLGVLASWSTTTGALLNSIRIKETEATSVAIHPENMNIASSSENGFVHIRDITNFRELAVLGGNSSAVNSLSSNSQGNLIALTAKDGSIRVLNIQGRGAEVLHTDSGRGLYQTNHRVALNEAGTVLASVLDDSHIKVRQVENWNKFFTLKGHYRKVNCMAIHPDRALLATASSDNSLRLWNLQTEEEIEGLYSFDAASISRLAFSPDGSLLASAHTSRVITIWDMRAHKELRVLQGHDAAVNGLAFNEGKGLLASVSDDKSVCIWEPRSGAMVVKLRGHTEAVENVSFNTSGTLLASSSWDHTIRIWDCQSYNLVAKLIGHTRPVHGVAFSSDSTSLISASTDGTVRVWDVHALDTSASKNKSFKPDYKIIVPAPSPPFLPSWARFDGEGNLLEWSDTAIDHWLYSLRDGYPAPIETVL